MTSERGHIRIASRTSALAIRQVEEIQDAIERQDCSIEIIPVNTQGDIDDRPFPEMDGQGFFVKAVQEAVLQGEADLAVHSYKDLPSAQVLDLEVAAVPLRADPRDALLVRPEQFKAEGNSLPLKLSARVGTSSARRKAQLLCLREDLEVSDIRGNVPTRIDKLRNGDLDAIVVAAAALESLRYEPVDLKLELLDPRIFVPAPAQGALALEIRRNDYYMASLLTELHDPSGYRAVAAERGLLAMLQGGCQVALGAHATFNQGLITLCAWYEGNSVVVEHPNSEGAAMLAYDALGRPTPHSTGEVK